MPTRGLVVFDLEAALLSVGAAEDAGPGVAAFGPDRRLQLASSRVKEARSLRAQGPGATRGTMSALRLAPLAEPSIARLKRHGIACGIVSLGWDFRVDVVALRLGIEHSLGTGLERNGSVVHVWPEDRADFVARVAEQLGIPTLRTQLVLTRTSLPELADTLIRRWAEPQPLGAR